MVGLSVGSVGVGVRRCWGIVDINYSKLMEKIIYEGYCFNRFLKVNLGMKEGKVKLIW